MESLVFWVPVGATFAYIVWVFNRLIARRNACTNARAGIDVNLQRRHDLIPNLVESVRGYASHEQHTLEHLARAREQAVAALGEAGSAGAEDQLSRALLGLTMRAEAYPELQADHLYDQLMRNLTEAEEQISASRRAFNAQVLRLNNLVQQFPSNLVANLFNFEARAFYAAGADAAMAPAVELANKAGG